MLQESGLKRSTFIAGLGYRNTTGGLRSLDRWLDCGAGDSLLIERLVQAHGIDPATVRLALSETDAQHLAEYEEAVRRQDHWDREHFRPYVFVETRPGLVQSSFTVAAIVAPALKMINLPDTLITEPRSAQIQIVSDLVRRHYVVRQGKLPLFGPIIGYRFVSAYDESIRLDVAGNLIEHVAGHFVGAGWFNSDWPQNGRAYVATQHVRRNPMSYDLRYVARHLRYLPLPALVGQTVTLRSLRTASDDVIQHALSKLTNLQFTRLYDDRQIEIRLAKHSFWDAAWRVDGSMEWNPQMMGLPLLSRLGYFTTGDAAKSMNESFGDVDFYEVLREDIEAGHVYLRLLLQTESERVGRHSRRWPSWLKPVESALMPLERWLRRRFRSSKPQYSLPPWFFPHQYVILDAALTNLQGCWMARYPYI